jgi:hypothetical protein
MTEESNVPIPVPMELYRKMSQAVDSCRDLAFQLNKDYVYDQCVELQKLIQEFQNTWPSQEELDDLDELSKLFS